eukprot:scaffold248937_cov15-Tisochrysis_lutea.AAC.1
MDVGSVLTASVPAQNHGKTWCTQMAVTSPRRAKTHNKQEHISFFPRMARTPQKEPLARLTPKAINQ